MDHHTEQFEKIVKDLSDLEKYNFLYHQAMHNMPMPSIESLTVMIDELKRVLFPGYFGNSEMRRETIQYYIGSKLESIFRILAEQIKRGFCFACNTELNKCASCDVESKEIALKFLQEMPNIKHLLSTDVQAAFNGDPAAKNFGEIIFSYPSILALTHHRIAHALVKLNVPLIPRIIAEMAHSKTGIDIHPGAQIDEHFFIDHGTGVVIGETCVIGKNVRLYQSVTLGAKSFPLDENGQPIKGVPRHPILEDDVTVYSNATVLGRITIGKGSVIGANQWITHDLEPNSTPAAAKH